MRDDHLRTSHLLEDNSKPAEFDESNEDEIEPLLFDLVTANKVEAVKVLSPYIEKLSRAVREQLAISAAWAGSPDLLRLFATSEILSTDICINVVQTGNINLSKVLLNNPQLWTGNVFKGSSFESTHIARLFVAVIKSDSHELYEIWSESLGSGFGRSELVRPSLFASGYQMAIAATQNDADREQLLLKFWEEHDSLGRVTKTTRLDRLSNIAQTTCSINLARYALNHDCEVDWRSSQQAYTPLHWAAKRNTEQAARFMEFLLMEGADPTIITKNRGIQHEKGAIGISTWLGVSWDNLIERTTKERQRRGK